MNTWDSIALSFDIHYKLQVILFDKEVVEFVFSFVAGCAHLSCLLLDSKKVEAALSVFWLRTLI